jgi:hypothetical protein
MTARCPSRLRRGTGEPHVRQIVVEKLLALGRSNLNVSSRPAIHSKFAGSATKFVECPLPVALRQREQWQWAKRMNGPRTRYRTAPQRQLP